MVLITADINMSSQQGFTQLHCKNLWEREKKLVPITEDHIVYDCLYLYVKCSEQTDP